MRNILDELFDLARRAYPYRHLERAEFDEVVAMLTRGFETRRGRRGALLHHDTVHGRLNCPGHRQRVVRPRADEQVHVA